MTDAPDHQLVIVRRRRGGDDEGHHGGVWKIAFADFMTALMAFFLIMWLVNASDKETIVQIAAYFNPVQLTDTKPSIKGVKATNAPAISESSEEAESSDDWAQLSKLQRRAKVFQEQKLFENPTTGIDEITAGVPPQDAAGAPWPRSESRLANRAFGDRIPDPYFPFGAGNGRPAAGNVATGDVVGAKDGAAGNQADRRDRESTSDRLSVGAPGDKADATDKQMQSPSVAARQAAAEITRELRPATLEASAPGLEIRATDEGVLISVTDKANFGMFDVGSARPKPSTIQLMQRLSGVLAGREGSIVVSGHTDARPYRTELYDNWRLSSARAHMAQYMLVHGGVAESRIERVEAHAAKRPLVASDQFAAQNRRVDVLLRIPRT